MVEVIRDFFESSTIMVRLTLAFGIILISPRIFQKIRLPGILGLIAAGLLFGPDGLQLFHENGAVLVLFSIVGKLMLLFYAGLDTGIDTLKKNFGNSVKFATISFCLPTAAGIIIARLVGYDWLASVMLGILLSSHSVIAYPVLVKFGLARLQPIVVTIGATALTDIVSLLLFGICILIHTVGFSIGPFLLQLFFILLFIPFVLFVFKGIGRFFFKHISSDASEQTIFLLLVLLISSIGAELVKLEPIVGAFLAGLAVNSTLPNNQVRNQLELIGNMFFVPAFFISLGLLIEPKTIISTLKDHYLFVTAVIASLVASKFIAARLSGRLLGYSSNASWLMGALTNPQVASTIAAALIAYESMNSVGERLIDATILNTILVLMIVSTVIGMIATELYAPRVAEEMENQVNAS